MNIEISKQDLMEALKKIPDNVNLRVHDVGEYSELSICLANEDQERLEGVEDFVNLALQRNIPTKHEAPGDYIWNNPWKYSKKDEPAEDEDW